MSIFALLQLIDIFLMKEILTPKEQMKLLDSGILHCSITENAYLDVEDGRAIIEGVQAIYNGKKIPVFVDIRNAKGASSECRRLFQGKEIAKYQNACALLVDSPLTQLLGSFFLGLNKTEFPTRLFTNQDKALEWLKSYV
ncbi:STAS/SEC14 domain-containing protein [Owenweeksia hongkongensis]|uniref:STAS/SEC14 domain-containing protein n=1 Tax=Owenweeksia hongkongensis TaxID=253245 RepID=UPI003A91B6E5